ncbi:hypothetical protein EAF00_005637 [Botryotinia globosa]|nr:hypothetical protein EAF00_005637 [Botryotinia globosa]
MRENSVAGLFSVIQAAVYVYHSGSILSVPKLTGSGNAPTSTLSNSLPDPPYPALSAAGTSLTHRSGGNWTGRSFDYWLPIVMTAAEFIEVSSSSAKAASDSAHSSNTTCNGRCRSLLELELWYTVEVVGRLKLTHGSSRDIESAPDPTEIAMLSIG